MTSHRDAVQAFDTYGLVRVSENPVRYRSGRWLLVALGVGYVVAGALLVWRQSGFVLWPRLSHGSMVLLYGMVAILAASRRPTAVLFTAVSAAATMMLVIISSVAVLHGTSLLGLGTGEILFFGVLGAVNLALLMWLCPDAVQGTVWRYRRDRPEYSLLHSNNCYSANRSVRRN
ncbi:hypothetical protein CQY20_12650 [Mycolicibacterium agri]|uniref:Uncharacterized protein n=1 Tax=Mycolicibacterium agri TaxID=36811 RepID=A0A2A7N3X4_MYCAG|nr:hypothetical protein [Mycolicibacterium agri]PEG38550.1 hypothetical protein CQY20_12650 [Mycolicibacterium agri]